ncbi:ribbon-helix-helix domain-containing protein [Robiginitomaculum antarcticum]|uniref:ribbon-helix-helix domain-containing protein n=1 Tax=Robiginitomaculum antarcticum TaxID=437507 RepID=UPI00037B565C|nr:type II toxin-antitoxin system ParD family antitoxin [Robiginitomaculum antarcticum]
MTRASISLTEPNDEWIQTQIDSKEYSSRSDLINDILRKARKDNDDLAFIRAKLIASEQSLEKHGAIEISEVDLLKKIKAKVIQDGSL